MTRLSSSNPAVARRHSRLKAIVWVALIVFLGIGVWSRWIPGRPVPPEWARGGVSPANSLFFETADDSPVNAAPDADVLSSPDFLFTMGEGSGRMGYDVIRVRADGRCDYTCRDLRRFGPRVATRPATAPAWPPAAPTAWRRATFQVGPAVVADLRRLLVDTRYFGLKKVWQATYVSDGTQWFVRARAGGREKGVFCSNHFPAEVIRLNDFVRTRVVDPYRDAIAGAAAVELPEDWAPDF